MAASPETQRLSSETQRIRIEQDYARVGANSSVYGGVILVFFAMLVAHAFQCWGIVQQRKQLNEMEASLNQLTPQYDLIDLKLSLVSEDLLKLASTSSAADRITKEFSIRQNSAPSSPEGNSEK
jgi:hypothetical protein